MSIQREIKKGVFIKIHQREGMDWCHVAIGPKHTGASDYSDNLVVLHVVSSFVVQVYPGMYNVIKEGEGSEANYRFAGRHLVKKLKELGLI